MPDIPTETRDTVVRWIGQAVTMLPAIDPGSPDSATASYLATQELARAVVELGDGPNATRSADVACDALQAAAEAITGMRVAGWQTVLGGDPKAPVLRLLGECVEALDRYKDSRPLGQRVN